MSERIFITGFGGITAAGKTMQATWDAIKAGKSGIRMENEWRDASIENYKPRELIADRKLLKLISKQDVLGLYAANHAIAHSGILDFRAGLADPTSFNDRTGIVVGSPGNKFQQQHDFLPVLHQADGQTQGFAEAMFREVHPMWLLRILPNNVLAYIGIQHGFKGANENITNHGVSGSQAIIEAYHMIKRGLIDRAVVVAYDLGQEPQALAHYHALGTLSDSGAPAFSSQRDGTVLGEGAGAIVLESESAASARQAHCYAEFLGGHVTSEAKGVFAIDPCGEGVQRCISATLDAAKMSPADVGMITAHANGTPQSDRAEAMAIANVFGENTVPVTGFKWAIGHTLSAAGMIETILTILAAGEACIPGLPGGSDIATDCQSLKISSETQALSSPISMILNRGFASLNTALLMNVKPRM